VQPDERERHPVRHLQLEVAVVLEAVRVEAVDERAHERGSRRPRQAVDEHVGRERREQEPRQKENVVGDDGMDTGRPQRHRRQRRQEHRIGEGQRQRLGVEDIAAEERARIATPLLVDPAHPPHRKQRIAEIRHRVHAAELRLEEDRAK
jgi:hypothetical protein